MFWETVTFVSSSLCQLDVVWVRLKYPNTASAGLLRWGVFISGLGQTGDLGARSSRAGIHNPGLYACSDLCTDIYIHLFCSVAYFHPNCTSAKHLVLQTYYYHIFSLAYSNVLQVILEIYSNLTTRLCPSMVGYCSAHFSCGISQSEHQRK